ncbi:MAG: endolytic transglycosylase MltG [Halanaerobiaceae bacterium]
MNKGGVIILIFALLLALVFQVHYYFQPVDPESREGVVVKIEPGFSTDEIATHLYENKIIHSPLFFKLITSISGVEQKLQAGYYLFSPADSLKEVISDLESGRVDNFKLTLPEGFTIQETIDRLVELTDYEEEDFLELVHNRELIEDYMTVPDQEFIYPLEGFLYPSTYSIPRNFGPEAILRIMLREFVNRWGERLDEESGTYTPFEIVVIASMVEKEARLSEEKEIIAGVIYNRLEEEMLLQIDATVQYSLEQRQQILLFSDLRRDSLYNTYLYQGLPPGPIASPGDESLKAALDPADTDYMFYFAREDGSHIFSETYQEHKDKLEDYRDQTRD